LGLVGSGKKFWSGVLTKFAGSLHTRLVVKGELDLPFPIFLGIVREVETDLAFF